MWSRICFLLLSGLRSSLATPAQLSCFAGGEAFELTISLPEEQTITVPQLPAAGASDWSYATENALVSIPKNCLDQFKDKIKAFQILNDRQPCGSTGMGYFYISDLDGGYATLSSMTDCAEGLVIEAAGSGGPGWSAVQFAAIFSGMGLVQVIPNHMAMPEDLGLKGRLPMKTIEEIDVSNYCGGFTAFDGECGGFNKPYCYSTKVENIVGDSDNYRQYVEGVYQMRKRELDYFMDKNAELLSAFERLYLVGNSEGGMVASRYHHAALDAHLTGRIISAWSCNYNYFVSCPDSTTVCDDQCDKSVPQLNVIGGSDEYFGSIEDSVSSQVAANPDGYGGPITGNCRMQYDSQGFTKATVVVLDQAGHGPQYYNDNTVRSVFADFLAHTGESASEWESLKACTSADGVYTCPTDGPDTCKTIDDKYQVNPNATCNAVGAMPFKAQTIEPQATGSMPVDVDAALAAGVAGLGLVDAASIAGLEGSTWPSSPQSCILMGVFVLVSALGALAFQSSGRVQVPEGTELLEAVSPQE